MRRLPIYFLIDCSCTMAGEPIEAVAQGLRNIVSDFRGSAQVVETALVSVITFASIAHEAIAPVDLMEFQEPSLRADPSPGVVLGAALTLLEQSLSRHFRAPTPTEKGDWLPQIILVISEPPTDEIDAPLARVRQRGIAHFVTLLAGPAADRKQAEMISDHVISMNNLVPDQLTPFFCWTSARF